MATPIDSLKSIDLGKQGENLSRSIEIDVSAWTAQTAISGATFYILHQRNNDVAFYQVSNTTLANDVLTWNITNVDTSVAGTGYAEIAAVNSSGTVLKKTGKIPTSVEATIDGAGSGTSALEEYLTTLSTNIASLSSTVTANKALADATETKAAANQSSITTLGTRTSTLESGLTAAKATIPDIVYSSTEPEAKTGRIWLKPKPSE